MAPDSLFPHQVDARIGDSSPDRRIGVAADIGLHDRENHRNEGRHDPASIMHLSLAPSFGKGRSAMEDLVPKRVEPLKDDSQYPVNILSRQFSTHARCLPFESHLPIGTFRRTLHPLPKRGEHVLILEKNSNGAGKRIPDDSFDVVSSVSFQHSSEKIAELPPLGQALRVQCIRAIGRIEGDPEEDEPLPVGGGYFASFEPARNVGLRCANPTYGLRRMVWS